LGAKKKSPKKGKKVTKFQGKRENWGGLRFEPNN